MIFDFPKPEGSRLVWGEDFETRQIIQSRGGIIVGLPTIGNRQGGSFVFNAPNYTCLVWYPNTRGTLLGATKATWRIVMKTDAASATSYLFNKGDLANRQWDLRLGTTAAFAIDTAGGAHSKYGSFAVTPSTIYDMLWVFDGSGATNPDRLKCYLQNGTPQALAFTGTIPATLQSSAAMAAQAIVLGGLANGTDGETPVGYEVYLTKLWSVAFSAQEAADEQLGQTYSKAFGGGP